MDNRRSSQENRATAASTIRFVDDSSLTFVNYRPDAGEGFAYRPEARIHNARRRLTRPTSIADMSSTATSQQQQQQQQQVQSVDVVSMAMEAPEVARDLQSVTSSGAVPPEQLDQDVLISRQIVESVWRSVFVQTFYLPHWTVAPPGILNPADAFMVAARSSPEIYRSVVTQPVLSALAKTDKEIEGVVFQNQALILQNFRRLSDSYSDPSVILSTAQFQQIFASAFALSGNGFDQEAGYNAVIFLNAFFMHIPENHAVMQTPVAEWCRMLMPRPGPSFWRSEMYQREMWRKIELALSFFQSIQDDLKNPWPEHVALYLHPDRPIYKFVTISSTLLQRGVVDEPFTDFHVVNFHRTLSLVYRLLSVSSQKSAAESDPIMTAIEHFASTSLHFPTAQCVSVFLWCLVSYKDVTDLSNDHTEVQFAWAVKELLLFHDFAFADHITNWILYKSRSRGYSEPRRMDIVQARAHIENFYPAYAIG